MARLKPITGKDQVPAKHHGIVDAIIKSRGGVQGPFRMFMHCPELAGHLEAIGGYVRFKGSLDMRVRVLAAMVVARELDGVYVWGAQSGSARKQGVPRRPSPPSARSTAAACRRKTRKSRPRARFNKH
jgi:4-carboxymuconolactone decarboxylase